MGDLSPNFSRAEFMCRCGCGRGSVDYETLVHLEHERAHFGDRTLIVTSGYRCAEHNARVGGSPNSWHLTGAAVDHYILGVEPAEQFEYFDSRWPDRYGIGLYQSANFLHFDSRGPRARWSGDSSPDAVL